jgi:hypothetical protein
LAAIDEVNVRTLLVEDASSALQPPLRTRLTGGAEWPWHLAAGALAVGVVAWLVANAGAPSVLVALAGATTAVVLVLQPHLATPLAFFLLYVNFPAILTKQHGMPAAVAGAFIGLLVLPIAREWVVRRVPPRVDTTFALMVLLAGAMVLSTLKAVDRALAFDNLLAYALEGLLLYWLVINCVRNLRMLRRSMWTVVSAAALLCALSLYQDLTGNYTNEFGGLAYRNYEATDDSGERVTRRRTWDRAQGPVDDPNRFAQITIVLLPVAMFLYRTARRQSTRLAAAVLGLLLLAGIGLTLSRGAFVTLVLMAIVMAHVRWVRPLRLAVVAVAITAALSAVSPYLLSRIVSMTEVFTIFSGDRSRVAEADGAIRRRTTQMLAALYVFRDHPIIGVGPGQFSPFYVEEYSQDPGIKFREVVGPRRAHSLYLEMAAELGIIGLSIFLFIVGLVVRRLWQLRQRWSGRDPVRADLAAAFALSLAAYLSTGIFLHLAFQRYFWFLLALSVAAIRVIQRRPGRYARRAARLRARHGNVRRPRLVRQAV